MTRSTGPRPAPDAARQTDSRGSDRVWPLLCLLLTATVVAYANGLSGPFVYDDELAIVGNRSIRELRLPDVLVAEQDTPTAGRPLVNLSLALNYATAGLAPRTYHVSNLLVHLGCSLLLFGLVRRTLELPAFRQADGQRPAFLAFAAALVWAVHPLNSEVVEYVTQRTESMMAMCYLATMYASVRATTAVRPMPWLAVSVLASAAGMACKESMATAPVIVVLYDAAYVHRTLRAALSARWRFYLALAATWIVLGALLWSDPRGESAGFSGHVSPWTYLLNQAVIIPSYLEKAVWPRALVAGYGWPAPVALPDVLPQAFGLVGLLIVGLVTWVQAPPIGFLAMWFFITLAPASSIVPIPTEVGADRRMYLPLVGLAVAAVIGTSRLLQGPAARAGRAHRTAAPRRLRAIGAIVLALATAALISATVARNREYASPLTLYRTVVERRPTSVSHHILGSTLMEAGLRDEALRHLEAALPGAPRAHYDIGVEMFNQGRFDQAIPHFEAVIAARESPPARHPYWQAPVIEDVVGARVLIGRALAQQQKLSEAAEQFERALSVAPTTVEARRLLATVLFSQRSFEQAVQHYRLYLASRPDDADALTNLAIGLISTGHDDEAVTMFRRVVALNPSDGRARRNLAHALFDRDEVEESAVHAAQAVQFRPDDPDAHDLLGRALGVQGRFDEALVHFGRALELDPGNTNVRARLDAARRAASGRGQPATPK